MVKILSAEQIRAVDKFTISSKHFTSIALMEDASSAFVQWFQKKFSKENSISVFCGLGNNGGDGLAIARLLFQKKYKVEVFIVRYSENCSEDFLINEKRLKNLQIPIHNISSHDKLQTTNYKPIIIDAIFGSGLNRPASGLVKKVIQQINKSNSKIISVDIPSSLFADKHTNGIAIRANYTVSFQIPKLAFFFPENYKYVGEWETIDIGLNKNFITKQATKHFFITKNEVAKIIKPRKKFAHKGTFGHALIIAGSYGKIGAAILSAKACLQSGAGLVTVHLPKSGSPIMQKAFPEAMVSIDKSEKYFSKINDIQKFDAIGIGPGIGTLSPTQKAFFQLLKQKKKPLVIDADAINILGQNKKWIPFIPKNSILTPHPKEFERLVGKSKNDFHRHEMQINFAVRNNLFLILKTAHTCIATPDGKCFFNSTGNPGMATAGSGDVLTGILTGLLAQGYNSENASILGIYLHGLAGDTAAKKKSMEAMLASDIIDNLGNAFKSFYK